jgi:hypothetical protein
MCSHDYPGAVVLTAPSNKPMKLPVAFGARSLSAELYVASGDRSPNWDLTKVFSVATVLCANRL